MTQQLEITALRLPLKLELPLPEDAMQEAKNWEMCRDNDGIATGYVAVVLTYIHVKDLGLDAQEFGLRIVEQGGFAESEMLSYKKLFERMEGVCARRREAAKKGWEVFEAGFEGLREV